MNNNSYDELNYNSSSFPYSSIDRLNLISKLYNLNPPDIDKAKVLEIGCSMGGNIFPAAIYHPTSEFIGIDLSHSQINKGNLILEYMGMKNIKLLQKDVTTIDKEFGMFDYIICHGVYSWVPDFVKDAILAVCKNNLTENGVAYISYNTYPGWKFKDISRDYMLYMNDCSQNLLNQVNNSFKHLDLIQNSLNFNGSQTIQDIFNNIKEQKNHYIAHEHLSEINDPIYFHEFNQRINNHGLSFIVESLFHERSLNVELKNICEKLSLNTNKDLIKIEQINDFLNNRGFRQSIITHTKNHINVDYSQSLSSSFIEQLKISANVISVENDSENKGSDKDNKKSFKIGSVTFSTDDNNKLFSAIQKAYPNSIDLGVFFKQLKQTDGINKSEIKSHYHSIINIIYSGQAHLSLNSPPNFIDINEDTKIKVLPEHIGLAQYMIDFKDSESINFSNYKYNNIKINPNLDKFLIIKMDGTKNKKELIDYLAYFIQNNKYGISYSTNGVKITELSKITEISTQYVENLLKLLQTNFLLI